MKKNDNVDVYIGQTFKEYRKKKNYSVRYMAERLGVSSTSYYYYEIGKMSMSLKTFMTCCNILDVDATELFEESKKHI